MQLLPGSPFELVVRGPFHLDLLWKPRQLPILVLGVPIIRNGAQTLFESLIIKARTLWHLLRAGHVDHIGGTGSSPLARLESACNSRQRTAFSFVNFLHSYDVEPALAKEL